MKTFTTKDFANWGSEGGKKSKRKLSAEKAREMVKSREAKRKGKK